MHNSATTRFRPLLGIRLLSSNKRYIIAAWLFSKSKQLKEFLFINIEKRFELYYFLNRLLQSVILLSRLPFTNLFYEILASIAPKFFADGENVLDNACLDISNWPSLQAGECIQLPLLGSVYQTYIPSLTSANLQQAYTPVAPPHNSSMEKNEVTDNDSATQMQPKASEVNDKCKNAEAIATSNSALDESSQASSSNVTPQSPADILVSYKQSKEILLSKKENSVNSNSQCDKNSNTSIGANVIDNENDDQDDEDSDDGDYSTTDIKINDHTSNTQTNHSTNLIKSISTQSFMQRTPIVLSSVHEIDIFRSLYAVLSYTHLLWELVLTAEPIVIMATSPSDCSLMVQCMMSLIAPLSYSAEARPYFTIHDSEFKEFTQRQQGPVPIILGVTNPFFSKTLQHWPHLIRMTDSTNGNFQLLRHNFLFIFNY